MQSSTIAPSKPVERLTALDRCDRCRAQAYVEVTTRSGELLFCAHHFGRYEDIVTAAGYDVHDERHKLTEED